ncbi:MAG TPA: aldo/keto reductase [Polyangiaceae bacterium]|nr:aldo/keto reductase [Polyangiaceae bacterium]
MITRPLGSTGVAVSAIGFGAMPLSIAGRPREDDSIRILHAALDAGMTLFDTADVYCLDHRDIGHNERLVAEALRRWSGSKEGIFVATKGGLERPSGEWTVNAKPEHLKSACEASLRALGVDTIALYQLHAPDDRVPFAESVGALAMLRAEGKIAHVGLSNVNARQLEEALAITPIASVQNRCNPFERQSFTTGVVAACETHGVAFLAHSPVGGHRGHARVEIDPTLTKVGARAGLTPYQVCLVWLLGCSRSVIPIPGASRAANAVSSAKAMKAALDEADWAALGRAFPIEPSSRS